MNSFSCLCAKGYEGDRCEINTNDCDPDPCENGGICRVMTSLTPTKYITIVLTQNLVNDYLCVCETGWTGERCSVNINDCATDPCQNGGRCFVSTS